VKDEVSQYSANMGGTNIYDPLKFAIGFKSTSGFQKRIFLLTDGAVSEPDKVI
jgi:hypothetical protein